MRERRNSSNLEPLDAVGVQIPYHFRCPISLELMCDPVTVCTGQTYDRASIESWVAMGNTTCPVTRVPLSDFSLIPNHTLRRLIQDWCVANRSFGVERIPTPKQPADPAMIRSLLNQVGCGSIAVQSRVVAARRLNRLARDSEKNRLMIGSVNVREILLSVLFSESDCDLRNESLAILSMFQLNDSDCSSISSDLDRIAFLVSLLFDSSFEVRVNAAALIETVVAGTRSPELRSNITAADDIFEGIIGVISSPIAYPRAVKIGIKALFALCLSKQHRHKAITAGAAAVLIDRIAELDKCEAERALATVELLCRVPAGCAAVGAHALAVPVLVRVVLKVSERATEYAAGSLVALCTAAERLQREAVAAGAVTQMLLVVQSECTERAKRKAQMLLKLVRDSWPEEPIGNSNDFNCSDVVPF